MAKEMLESIRNAEEENDRLEQLEQQASENAVNEAKIAAEKFVEDAKAEALLKANKMFDDTKNKCDRKIAESKEVSDKKADALTETAEKNRDKVIRLVASKLIGK